MATYNVTIKDALDARLRAHYGSLAAVRQRVIDFLIADMLDRDVQTFQKTIESTKQTEIDAAVEAERVRLDGLYR